MIETMQSLRIRRIAVTALALTSIACSGGGDGSSDTSDPPPPPSANDGRWSDPATWPGQTPPAAGDDVTIPAGTTIALDTATPALGRVVVQGTLTAYGDTDLELSAENIMVMPGGSVVIGTSSDRYEGEATITLTGARGTHTPRAEDNALSNDGVARSLMVMNGGTLSLHGQAPAVIDTKLNAHAASGDSSFTLADPVDWRAGDRIAIAITDFYGVGETEVLTLAADAVGNQIQTTSAIATSRWGRLQYPLDSAVGGTAMSLTPGTFTPPDADVPTVLDERAEIVNLTRNIVIQGANDSDWQGQGFGAHVMIMGRDSVARVDGVELRRVGQRQAMGRYPFHWHMLSYESANASGAGGGAYIGDVSAVDHYLRNASIHQSENRAVTIHGTCGVSVTSNVAVDIKGHAYFFEDGSERRNVMTDCIAMKVRAAGPHRLKQHDNSESSGFWLTNPDNTIERNVASDCQGRGLWNSFAGQCFGDSRNVNLDPSSLTVLAFNENVGHSNRQQGIVTEFAVVNEAGSTVPRKYVPATETFEMIANGCWKNGSGGYLNRAGRPTYRGWWAADNSGVDISGATNHEALFTSALLVGTSLNDATPPTDVRRRAIASYHWAIDIVNIAAINYPFVAPTMETNGLFTFGQFILAGGVIDHSDLYIDPISLGSFRNEGWHIVNSHPGYLTPPAYFDGFPVSVPGGDRHWALSGAVWDPHGYWGPAGNYLVPLDIPFYTHDVAVKIPLTPSGVSTPHLFYGLGGINPTEDTPWWAGSDPMPMRLERLDAGMNVVGEHTIGDGATSVVGDFAGFKHFGVAKGGVYRMVLLDGTMPEDNFNLALDNAYRSDDWVVIGLPWNGQVPITGRIDSGDGGGSLASRVANGTARELFATGTSLADVLNDPTGATMWQDTANDLVWVKHVGGLALNVFNYDGRNDESLARRQLLRLSRQ